MGLLSVPQNIDLGLRSSEDFENTWRKSYMHLGGPVLRFLFVCLFRFLLLFFSLSKCHLVTRRRN